MGINFTTCGQIFTPLSDTVYIGYRYNGTIASILHEADRPALITIEGCRKLCGEGYERSDFPTIASTLTTWVLPVLGGLLLQAPFESNRARRTMLTVCRWLGSPISSLTYILWNIKCIATCALAVDMSVGYSTLPTSVESDFSEIRDALFILSVMNQFTIPRVLPNMSAEKLLRIALFSTTLTVSGENLSLVRKALAAELRSRRRQGIIPVFISIFWFGISLAISIYTAFGNLGERATALNLGLGLMLGWLPVFVLACVVDRNPSNTSSVQASLNSFVNSVREALLEPNRQSDYVSCQTRHQRGDDKDFLRDIATGKFKHFFRDFAGQGRIRWHYGVGHSILGSLEDVGVAEFGRDWLKMPKVHDLLILGPEHSMGLHYFDRKELWQIVPASLIIWGILSGAWVISYLTPTLGLGCRSGSYLVYAVLISCSFAGELVVWFGIARHYEGLEATYIPSASEVDIQSGEVRSEPKRPRQLFFEILFAVFDVANTIWLFYMVLSQTMGFWETCDCVGSGWGLPFGGPGGYIDFLGVVEYKALGITTFWWTGTGISLGVMSLALIYLFIEWCTQSHLSTEDYNKALNGLKRTRRWKRIVRWTVAPVLFLTYGMWNSLSRCCSGRVRNHSRTSSCKHLTWSVNARALPSRDVQMRLMTPNEGS